MKRRELLRNAGFLTASVAIFGLPGCGSSSSSGSAPSADPLSQPGTTGSHKFPQGVMAADPKPDSIILWTRVVAAARDDVAQVNPGDADIAVTLEVATDIAFTTTSTTVIPAKAVYDNSIRHKLTGLDPAKTYYYRFKAGSGGTLSVSRIGRFKTAPAVDADVTDLRFAFVSCQDWTVNHWAGLEALAKQELDVMLHLGDYIYESVGDDFQSAAAEARHGALTLPSNTLKPGSTTVRVATTTEDYRYLYKKYRTDSRLQEVHARFPIIAIWDDHEFSDDCWQNNNTYVDGSVLFIKPDGSISMTYVAGALPVSNEQLGQPSTGTDSRQTDRRRSANRAWFEFMPADIPDLDESVASNFQTVRIYRDLQFGKLAHFIMTDERLYRADHVLPEAANTTFADKSVGTRYFVPEPTFKQVMQGKQAVAIQQAALAGQPDAIAYLGGGPMNATVAEISLGLVSVLGQTQRTWWKTRMASSTATWKFWGNEVSLLRMGLNLNQLTAIVAKANALADAGNPALKALLNTYIINADQWDGYAAERANLMGFLAANGIKNVVAVTGDIHAHFAGEVAADYSTWTAPGMGQIVDLVTAGVSSSSFWSYLAGVVGSFQDDVTATKTDMAAHPTTFTNAIEAATSPLKSLRPLVYTCANMLVYEQVKTAVIKQATSGAIDLSTLDGIKALDGLPDANKQALYRAVFGEYLKHEVPAGYAVVNTLNETLAGPIGSSIVAVAQQAGATIPNPYTVDNTTPPVQNPWIRMVETDTQGFVTVHVTPTKSEATFHFFRKNTVIGTAVRTPTADEVILQTRTVTVTKDSTALTVS